MVVKEDCVGRANKCGTLRQNMYPFQRRNFVDVVVAFSFSFKKKTFFVFACSPSITKVRLVTLSEISI